jgi:6-pyruvoyltetrahydropterin/6-carboxytetrahydropterin synthase
MVIYKAFTFAAAHRLPNVPEDHKCSGMHGHTFRIEVYFRGPLLPEAGWVMDFADIAGAFNPLREMLDHSYLNDIEGLQNPTSENIARWVWKRLRPVVPNLCRIVVGESAESGCIYEGEDD